METITTQNSKIKLSTINSFPVMQGKSDKPVLISYINFTLPYDSVVFLKLIDKNGKLVQILINGDFMASGQYSNKMELNDLLPGEYYCVIEANQTKEARLIRILGKNI